MIKKKREMEVGDPSRSLDSNLYPLSHHKKWKRARQRPGDEFTLEVTHKVAEKIVSR